jgi:nucleoid-associated protein YgaU
VTNPIRTVLHLCARVLAGIVVVAVMAVPVVAVAYAAGNPFTAEVVDRFTDRSVDDRTIIKILSIGFYVCWGWFCAPALHQLLTAGRRTRRTEPRPRKPATSAARSVVAAPVERPPGPRGLLARLARFAVSGAAVAATLAGPGSAKVAGLPTAPVAAVATAPTTQTDSDTTPARPAPDDITSIVAAHRDTPYALARKHFPGERIDAVRDEIVELNLGRPLPDGTAYRGGGFPPGWNVLIPTPEPGRADGDTASPGSGELVGLQVTVEVEPGDTLWDRSQRRLIEAGVDAGPQATGRYLAELIDTNRGVIDDPDLIYPGQRVVLPAIDRPTEPPPTTAPGSSAMTRYMVVHGDTLWDIVGRRFGFVYADLVSRAADFNGLDDPDLIVPGQLLLLPDSLADGATAPAAPTRHTPPPSRAPHAERSTKREAPTPASPTSPPPTGPPRPASVSDGSIHDPPHPSTTGGVPERVVTSRPVIAADPTPVTTTAPMVSGDTPDEERTDATGLFDVSVRTVWWQVPMGLLLAAGLVTMARRLRSRRLAVLQPGEQLAKPTPAAAGTELAATVVASDQVPLLLEILRTLTGSARRQPNPIPVRAVEVHRDRVEVLFTEPAPCPPPGWTTVDGGTSWTHPMAHPVITPLRQLVTPALVTVGHRDGGGEVLLDLETAGSVAVRGDRSATLGVARSMLLELATYPLGVAADLCPIGFTIAGVEHCDRVWRDTTITRAVRVARDTLDRTAGSGAASLIAARAATDRDEGLLDPQIFIVDAPSLTGDDLVLLDELVELCRPQAGAAVVILGDHRSAREVIDLESADRATWSGVALRPPIIDHDAETQAAGMLEHEADGPVEPRTPLPLVADLLATDPTPNADPIVNVTVAPNGDRPAAAADEIAAYRYVPPHHDVLVQVLGEVTVHGRDVHAADEVELLTLLTCMRDERPNVDTIANMLNTELGPNAIQSRVSRLRRKLGVGSDGRDLIPPAAAGRGSPGRYQVSPLVLTDAELIDHRYQTSLHLDPCDSLDVLRDGLTLFTGPSFRARKGYDWVFPERVQARIYSVVTDYAKRLMDLAFADDDIPLVLEAARCAGHVINDPVVELPVHRLIRDYADSCGDPDLAASVAEARRRLIEHIDDNDPLVEDE